MHWPSLSHLLWHPFRFLVLNKLILTKDCTHLASPCRLLAYHLNTKKCILFNSTTTTTGVLYVPLNGQHPQRKRESELTLGKQYSLHFILPLVHWTAQCVQTEANEANKLLSTVWTENDNDYRRNILTRCLQLKENKVYLPCQLFSCLNWQTK